LRPTEVGAKNPAAISGLAASAGATTGGVFVGVGASGETLICGLPFFFLQQQNRIIAKMMHRMRRITTTMIIVPPPPEETFVTELAASLPAGASVVGDAVGDEVVGDEVLGE
jgi:hypothetical protein